MHGTEFYSEGYTRHHRESAVREGHVRPREGVFRLLFDGVSLLNHSFGRNDETSASKHDGKCAHLMVGRGRESSFSLGCFSRSDDWRCCGIFAATPRLLFACGIIGRKRTHGSCERVPMDVRGWCETKRAASKNTPESFLRSAVAGAHRGWGRRERRSLCLPSSLRM